MKAFGWAAILAAGMVSVPALADVKAGVDAWARGDFKMAVEQWRDPAVKGDADAQFNLGQAYKLGRGVPVDPAMAQSWFRKAAAQGHVQAEDNLGLSLFQDGRKAEALPFLEKSVARDEKRAQLVLGTMLFNGDAVPKDWTRAYALVTRSSQQGLGQAGPTLAQMDQYVPAEQRQKGIALAQQYERMARAAPQPTPRATVDPAAPPAVYGARSAPAPAPKPTEAPAIATAKAPPPKAPAVAAAKPKPAPTPAASSAKTPAATAVAKATPAPKAAPKPASATGGNWRVQLGAFRDEANAKALWSRVGGKVGGKPAYTRAGEMTRLQATGFASRAQAQAACTKAGAGCFVVAP